MLIFVTDVKLRVEFSIFYCMLFETCKLIRTNFFYFHSNLCFTLELFSHKVGKGTDGLTGTGIHSVVCECGCVCGVCGGVCECVCVWVCGCGCVGRGVW